MFNFFFKNLRISNKKLKLYVKNILKISKMVFELLIYLNYDYNKCSVILRKMFLYILNNLRFRITDVFELKINQILVLKSSFLKKTNYRAKGNLNFFKKKYCNTFFILNI